MGVQDWSYPVTSHTFFVERAGFSILNPGTAWIFLANPYALFRLDLITSFRSARCRLLVEADMTGQPNASIAVAGATQNGAIDTDKVCIVTLTGGSSGRFSSAEDLLPGGLTGGLALTLVVKSSTGTGDLVLQDASLVLF